jgi:hypothetical protein
MLFFLRSLGSFAAIPVLWAGPDPPIFAPFVPFCGYSRLVLALRANPWAIRISPCGGGCRSQHRWQLFDLDDKNAAGATFMAAILWLVPDSPQPA